MPTLSTPRMIHLLAPAAVLAMVLSSSSRYARFPGLLGAGTDSEGTVYDLQNIRGTRCPNRNVAIEMSSRSQTTPTSNRRRSAAERDNDIILQRPQPARGFHYWFGTWRPTRGIGYGLRPQAARL
ncbi:hypothetical protein BO71DRAFT_238229 [Aspergillus ellipticus CBS 707.79]|uniref:Secreted protein n=1 Tax=Aspergillus ellipticus CBS 707.79 TaxID=1448320 RepID=A0A319DYK6_9EURO|nr:hypothetical protein BO71DRAFT_238229 [Aspergillus ellipticus CBS 707.79]